MAKFVFFDIETTGLNFWQHSIHQISGYIEIDGEIKEKFNYLVSPNPQAKIDIEALRICNKTIEEINGYESMEKVHKTFTELLNRYCDKFNKKDKYFLIGFNNAAFDNQFLRAWFVQNGDNYFGSWFWANPIDTFVLASQKLINKRATMQDFKLATVCNGMGIEVDETRLHDAMYDIELTRKLYYSSI